MMFEAGGQPISGAGGPITEPILDGVEAIEQATGTRPVGYNNYWFRPGVNTLEILQELGFTYHIDDLSVGEPFLQTINGQPSRVRVLDRIFTRLREHDDVWWARKDQIAQWVLDHPDTAARVDRDLAPVSGLPVYVPNGDDGTTSVLNGAACNATVSSGCN